MMHKKLSFLALTSTIWTAAVMADGNNQFTDGDEFADFYGQDELVSIATGTSTPISKAPSVASVISSKQIEAMGATHLDEVLERIPGLHVMRSDLSRLDPVYSVRGIQTGFNPQILVLLNGTEIKQLVTGGLATTFRMPVNNISRIEVIRGPGSAVYGADAYSGVINIITKSVDENLNGSFGIRAGRFGSSDVWAQKGYQNDDFAVSFSFENLRTDGDDSRIVERDLQTINDTVFGTNASQAPGSLNTQQDITNLHLDFEFSNWRLENWYWEQDHGGLGQGGAQALDNIGYQDANQFLTKLSYKTDLGETFRIETDLSFLRTDIDTHFVLFPAGAALPIGSDGNAFSSPSAGVVRFPDGYIGKPRSISETTKYELAGLYTGFSEHQIRIASGWTYNQAETAELKNFGPGVIDGTEGSVDGTLTNVAGTKDIYLQDQERTAYFVSIQDQWQLNNDWSFTGGLRWDHFSDFGSTINPRLALVWETSHDLTTKLLYGEAFRAPSFSEQHLINNPSALGNPDLHPEEIETFELAFDYRPTFETDLKLSLYSYKATDLIATVAEGSTLKYQNARNQDGYGAELEFDWRATKQLTLFANYAYQHSEDSDTGMAVPDAPKHSTYLDLQYRLNQNWSSSLQHYWIGNRTRNSGDSRDKVDDYHWVNAKLTRSFDNKRLKFSIMVKNLFDTDAREPSSASIPGDYPLEGRSVIGELRYKF
ncbi:TonB-dependent receptor [Pontibacterium sp. N1Y112]|uniref:TonB-dependent receptor n=1 Tax=Pontibacterium sinense TaxID=2781979 RepID=A0A8J7FWU6_9GAMM|nr:TonB-dependent receptor [Pontibacterium sinense]MBE9399075.1 TonB-dependent receptor [Pontibacterium sinense]